MTSEHWRAGPPRRWTEIWFICLATFYRDFNNTAEVWDFPRSCRDPVFVAVPQVSGSIKNVPAHFPSKNVQCWAPNPETICAFLQSWSLQNLPTDTTNLSGPSIDEKLMRHELYQLQEKSYQTVDIWTSFLPYFFLAGRIFSAVLYLLHI